MSRRGHRFVGVLTVATLLWAGCTDREPLVAVRLDDPASGHTGSFGLITLVHSGGSKDSPASLRLSGQFVHYRNIGRDRAVRALDLEVGTLPLEGVPGRCTVAPATRPAEDLAGGAPPGNFPGFQIDLLDAGRLTLESPDGRIELAPKDFPSILFGLSGVVYGTEEAEFVPEGEYVISGTGGAEVGSFLVAIPAPRALRIEDVNGTPVVRGPVGLTRGADLELTYEDLDPESDFLHVRLVGPAAAVSCLAADVGRFTVPASLVGRVGTGPARVLVQRVRVRPFSAPGVPEGEVVFLVEDAAQVTLGEN